jgi:prepilin-type N-terminal cleavage/methylation domain-containing protein
LPHRDARPDARSEAGFTLIELLVAAVVTSLLLGMVFDFGENVRDYSTRTSSFADARQQTRLVLDRIATDIRSAGGDPSGDAFEDGIEVFPVATETSLRLRRDLPQDLNGDGDTYDVVDQNDDDDTHDNDENENGDGVLDDAMEDITYSFDADTGALVLTDHNTGTTYTLADQVIANTDGTPLFQYELLSGEIVSVTVQITIQSSIRDEVQRAPAVSVGRINARPRVTASRVLDRLGGGD